MPRRRRHLAEDFLYRLWPRQARRYRILPEPDTRIRFAAPRWVFIFGMSIS